MTDAELEAYLDEMDRGESGSVPEVDTQIAGNIAFTPPTTLGGNTTSTISNSSNVEDYQDILDRYDANDVNNQLAAQELTNRTIEDIRSLKSLGEVKGSRTDFIQSLKTGLANTWYNDPLDRVASLKEYMGENFISHRVDNEGNILIKAKVGSDVSPTGEKEYYVDAPNLNKEGFVNKMSSMALDIPNFGANVIQSLPAARAVKTTTAGLTGIKMLATAAGVGGGVQGATSYVGQDLMAGRTAPSVNTMIDTAGGAAGEVVPDLVSTIGKSRVPGAVAGWIGGKYMGLPSVVGGGLGSALKLPEGVVDMSRKLYYQAGQVLQTGIVRDPKTKKLIISSNSQQAISDIYEQVARLSFRSRCI